MNTLYNLGYFEHLLKKDTSTAEEINKIRWEWIRALFENDLKYESIHVLDFGSGVGWFRAFRPDGIEVDTFDINPHSPQTGILRREYDIITFWDVLEHVKDLSDLTAIMLQTKYVALSVPLLPDDCQMTDWKHYRPGEHLRYWTVEEWDRQFSNYFIMERIDMGYPECPPREDIISLLYERT